MSVGVLKWWMPKGSGISKRKTIYHGMGNVERPTKDVGDMSSGEEGVEGVKTAAAGMRSATVRMKKVLGGDSVLNHLGSEGETIRVATLQKLEETDHTHSGARSDVPLDVEKAAIVEIAAGASPAHVAVKYELHQGYVRHALQRRFGSTEKMKEALRGLVLENALACNVLAATRLHEMSAPQAVMSGAILIDKALALDKSILDTPQVIDFAALADTAKALKVLRQIADGK